MLHRIDNRAAPLLFLAFILCLAGSAVTDDSRNCEALAAEYATAHPREAAPFTGANAMVYFLHVPRTGGRTFHSCFLKTAHPPRKRCPKAYDHLRIHTDVPNCYLLSSHDDFSVVSMLPDDVAVVTQLRDPVDRVISAYEFAVELAARYVRSSKPAAAQKAKGKVSFA